MGLHTDMGARFRVVTYSADNTAWRSRDKDLTVDVHTVIGMIAMLMAWLAGLLVHMTKEMARKRCFKLGVGSLTHCTV